MARRSPALLGTLLVAAFLAAGCPGGGTTPPAPTPRPSEAVVGKPSPQPLSPLPTIGTPSSPSPAASPSAGASPKASASPSTRPSTSPLASPAASNLLFYAADLPLTNNVGAGGGAVGQLSSDGKTFRVLVWTVGATGDLTGAQLRRGTDVAKALTLDAAKRGASGTWAAADADAPLTNAHLAALKKGEVAATVQTATNPTGESRGVLKPHAWAGVANLQQVTGAANATTATGAAWIALAANKTATIQVYTAGLTGEITAAELRKGLATETGPLVKALVLSADKKTASATWAQGSEGGALTEALLADLKAGKLYVAVRTALNPDGEIRGQVLAP